MMCHRVRPLRSLALTALGALACAPLELVDPAPEPAPTGDGGSVPSQGPPGFSVGEPHDGGPPPGTGGPRPPGSNEQCAEEAIRGELVPLDLLLVLDASGSMNLAVGNRTRWQLVAEALGAFVRDPRSAGLGVGFQTFPFTIHEKSCATNADCGGSDTETGRECARPFLCSGPGVLPATARTCDPNDPFCPDAGTRCVPSGRCSASSMRCVNLGEPCPGGGNVDVCDDAPLLCKLPIDSCLATDYERPKVPIGVLPSAMPMVTQGLSAVRPAGNTPIAAAYEGATRYLKRHLASHPDRRAAMVLATDAGPSGCANDDIEGVAAVLAAAHAGTPSLSTYVIGAVSPGDMIRGGAATRLAQAGGTSMPFILNDSAADLGTRFLEALNAIRGSALPCELRIPRPSTGMIDFNKVNVRFTGTAGADDLVYVASADRCDPARGGWYYDVDPARGTPSTVRVCEATCRRFAAEAGGTVELRFGCRTRIE
jgi:hypothetical protein